MTKMFDPGNTPYDLLEKLSEHQKILSHNQAELITAVKQQRDVLNEVVDQLNRNTELVNSLGLQLQAQHDRIMLLEMVRIYENTNKDDLDN